MNRRVSPSGKAWAVTIAAVCAGIAVATIQNKTLPCMMVLQDTFSLSKSEAGWLSSVFCVMGVVSAFPGAFIVKRAGTKTAGAAALVFAIVGALLGAVSKNSGILLLSRVVEGLGAGLISIAVPSIITMWFPPEKRGLPMGLWAGWQVIAMSLAFFFGTSLLNGVGWRGIWLVCAAVAAASLAAYMLLVKEPSGTRFIEDDESGTGSLKNVNVWLISAAMFFFNITSFGVATWAASCWSGTLEISDETANLMLSILYIIELPAVIFAGAVQNKAGVRRMLLISLCGMAVLALAVFVPISKGFLILLMVLYPVFEGAAATVLWSALPLTVRTGEGTAQAFALFSLMGNAGMFLGPPIAGAVIDSAGWGFGGGVLLVSAAIGAATIIFTRFSRIER